MTDAPPPPAPAPPAAPVRSLVDRLAEVFAQGPHRIEAMQARESYFQQAGKVFDDDGELFEGRMASFLEWYVIERPFRDGPPPAARVVLDAEYAAQFTEAERRAAVHLCTSHRSLFELAALGETHLEVDDLVGGARFSVVERRSTVGFEPGALFEARLHWDPETETVVFGRTFLFHPADARAAVLKLADAAADAHTPAADLLFQLSRLHVRWHRFGHLAAAKIYGGGGAGAGEG